MMSTEKHYFIEEKNEGKFAVRARGFLAREQGFRNPKRCETACKDAQSERHAGNFPCRER